MEGKETDRVGVMGVRDGYVLHAREHPFLGFYSKGAWARKTVKTKANEENAEQEKERSSNHDGVLLGGRGVVKRENVCCEADRR